MFAQVDLSAVVIVYFFAVWLISLSNKSEVPRWNSTILLVWYLCMN